MDELTNGFNEASADYRITWEYVPMTEFFQTALHRLYGKCPAADLVMMDNPDMPYYITTGLLADISDMEEELGLKELYYPVLLDTVYDKGKLYGLPMNCNNTALIYRRICWKRQAWSLRMTGRHLQRRWNG